MGLPSINITFQTKAANAIKRSQKGIVAMILQDSKEVGGHPLFSISDIPKTLSTENQAQIQLAFLGYVSPPRQVLLYVMDGTKTMLKDALNYFAIQQFDYLVGMPELTEADAQTIASWVKSERQNNHMVKAVLPNIQADSEAIINFTTDDIKAGTGKFTTGQYCARIAGLIAGTPMTISCTYAPLPDVSDVMRKPKQELDSAIDGGEFILFHDGEKVKVGRGVTSLTTTTADKGKAFQSIKIVEAADRIKSDIRMTVQDSYIGKYANSYDNKCLLIMAIKGYLETLENEGILAKGKSTVEIDLAAQEQYLRNSGIDTSDLSEQDIKEANTGKLVFLKAAASILDAIEDINLAFTI